MMQHGDGVAARPGLVISKLRGKHTRCNICNAIPRLALQRLWAGDRLRVVCDGHGVGVRFLGRRPRTVEPAEEEAGAH